MEAVFREKSYPANYPADALAIIDAMSFSGGRNVKILGSMAMRSQQYAGDYDLFEEVKTKGSEEEALRSLASKFKDIVKTLLRTKNIYVGDIKAGAIPEWEILNTNAGIVNGKIENYNAVESKHRIDELEKAKIISGGEAKFAHSLIKESMTPEDLIEAKKELKFHIVRWSPNEVLHGSKILRDKKRYTLEEAFSSSSLSKLDVIGFIQNNRFTDFSIIYEFYNNGKVLNEFPLNVSQSLKEDIIYYKAHGNHFKVLKRMLALAKLNKDSATVNKLIPVLNSDLGRLYLITSDVGTLIELLENERKVPMPLVRFELDQMKARMGNIYNLPDFLSEEHDLIGDINAILKMTNKSQLLSRLHQIKTKMEGILNTNAKAKGGRRGGATERERGIAARLREKYYSGTSATPFSNNLYQDLSLITHDPYDESIADGKSGILTGRPYLQALAKGMMSGVMPSGYPLERKGFFDPVSRTLLPPPPANAGVASEPPADNTWFEPGGRYNETDDVWRAFVLGNPTSGKREIQTPNALPIDEAAVIATGFRPLMFQTSSFPTAQPAVYNRFSKKPPPAYSAPVPKTFADVETEATPEDIQADYTETKREDDAERMEALQAELASQRVIDEERFASKFPPRDEEAMNAYQLLLQDQLAEGRQKAREQLEATRGSVLASPEFDTAVGDFTGNILSQAKEELAQDPAYQAQRRSQDADYQARMAQEAQARAEAEARAREQARAEAQARATKAEEVRAEVASLERVAEATKESYAKQTQSLEALEKVFNDAKQVSKLPEEQKKKVKPLMKAVEKGKTAMKEITQLSQFKAQKLALESELKDLPAGKAGKKRRDAIEEDLAFIPTELEKDLATAERHKEEMMTAVKQLNEIFFDYIIPKEVITTIGQRKAPEGQGVENLSTNPFYSEEETANTIRQIKEPRQRGIIEEVSEVMSINRAITDGFQHAIKMTAEMKKALDEGRATQADYDREIDRIPEETLKQLFITQVVSLVGKPAYFVIARHNPQFIEMIKDGVEGRTEKPFPPQVEDKRRALRGMAKNAFAETKFFENIFASYAPVPDDRLLTIMLMSQETSEVLKPGIVMSIKGNRDVLKQVEQVGKIMFEEGAEERDEHYFQKPESPQLRTWLSNTRKLLAGYSPFERNVMYSAVVMTLNEGRQFELNFPPDWLEGRIIFPRGFLSGRGRRRLTGGVGFANTEQGKKNFLKWVNRNWNALITKHQKKDRPKVFRNIFGDEFPFTESQPFRQIPRYYIVYNTRTHNVRVRHMDFTKPSDDDMMAIEFGVPIHRRDYTDFFKNDLSPPTQVFGEVLNTPPASPMAKGEGRVRNKSFAQMMKEVMATQ
jgi:hypothetical protein